MPHRHLHLTWLKRTNKQCSQHHKSTSKLPFCPSGIYTQLGFYAPLTLIGTHMSTMLSTPQVTQHPAPSPPSTMQSTSQFAAHPEPSPALQGLPLCCVQRDDHVPHQLHWQLNLEQRPLSIGPLRRNMVASEDMHSSTLDVERFRIWDRKPEMEHTSANL